MRVTVDASYEGLPEPAGDGATARLTTALVALEAAFEADRPDVVAVADDSDAALAAALVATKLLIPLEAGPGAVTSSPNGRVLAQLATIAA